jgi:predicted CxxxxCH...CXXCH cytochrome family protein
VPNLDTSHTTATQTTFSADCGNCHATTGSSPVPSAPVCDSCHTNLAARSPLVYKDCSSCHADGANGPNGAGYPNAEGAHQEHLALNATGTPVTCNTCHNTLNPATGVLADRQNHYARAKSKVQPGDVIFNSGYQAQTGTRSFDNVIPSGTDLTCSAVSCHGGKTTPNWQAGAITVNTQCTSCHTTLTTTTQYNGPISLNHNRSQHQVTCTICHNTTSLAVNHFTNLSTPALEGPASATIGGTGTAITSWDNVTKSCDPTCHGVENWTNNP